MLYKIVESENDDYLTSNVKGSYMIPPNKQRRWLSYETSYVCFYDSVLKLWKIMIHFSKV